MIDKDVVTYIQEVRAAEGRPVPLTDLEIIAALEEELGVLVEEEVYTKGGGSAEDREPWGVRVDRAVYEAQSGGGFASYDESILDSLGLTIGDTIGGGLLC